MQPVQPLFTEPQAGLARAQRFLCRLPLADVADVADGGDDSRDMARRVMHQADTGLHMQLTTIAGDMDEFPLGFTVLAKRCVADFFVPWFQPAALVEFAERAPEHFAGLDAIETFESGIEENDPLVVIDHAHGIRYLREDVAAQSVGSSPRGVEGENLRADRCLDDERLHLAAADGAQGLLRLRHPRAQFCIFRAQLFVGEGVGSHGIDGGSNGVKGVSFSSRAGRARGGCARSAKCRR